MTSSHPHFPTHIAIIMDGNGRWAASKGLSRLEGHQQGVETVKKIVVAAKNMGVKYLTLYAFSQENWNRPELEVKGLMGLLKSFLEADLHMFHDNHVKLETIGNINNLPLIPRKVLLHSIEKTKRYKEMTLILALSYGGRDELVRAFRAMARDVSQGRLHIDEIEESTVGQYLDTHKYPDPDLIIRSSGEFRSSNFLPWQSAYSEYHVTPVLWPDFSIADLETAIQEYQKRERRFGLTSQQIQEKT
ncbi:MAG: isoprenyl transferase [Bdellovibrionota bacterium]